MIQKVKEVIDHNPNATGICPYCDLELSIDDFIEGGNGLIQKATYQKLPFKVGLQYVSYVNSLFVCPNCRKILGVSRLQFGTND